jgi:hypothetical protein
LRSSRPAIKLSKTKTPTRPQTCWPRIWYVDYDGSISTKQQFLACVKSGAIAGEQINHEGVTVHLYGNGVAVSTGIYRDKGIQKGTPFSRRGRFKTADGNGLPANRL